METTKHKKSYLSIIPRLPLKRKLQNLYRRWFKRKKKDPAAIISAMLEDKVQMLYQRTSKNKQAPSQEELNELERLSKFQSFVKKKKIPLEKIVLPLFILGIGIYLYYLIYTPQTPIDIYAKITTPALDVTLALDSNRIFSAYSPIKVDYISFESLDSIFLIKDTLVNSGIAFKRPPAQSSVDTTSYKLSVNADPLVISSDSSSSLFYSVHSASFTHDYRLFIEQIAQSSYRIAFADPIPQDAKIDYFADLSEPVNHRFFLKGISSPLFQVYQNKSLLFYSKEQIYKGSAFTSIGRKKNGAVTFQTPSDLSTQRLFSGQPILSVNTEEPLTTGILRFPSIEGKTYQFEKGEDVSLNMTGGMISGIYLEKEGITVELSGMADLVDGGWPFLFKDLMPSKMDYILANRRNKLFYESFLAIIGLIYSAYLYFKSHR